MSTLPEPRPDGTLPMLHPPAWVAEGVCGTIPERFGDFEIVSKLGQGAFGQVYLARQVSLGRHVALKVLREPGARRDTEGQLLAGLEHDHIVKVFSAFSAPECGAYGLCLQYIPGADLGSIIPRVFEGGRPPDSGRALLDALDATRKGEPAFDPAALRDREGLAADDFAQAVCRLGGRLAEALAFAHARGVLHCDIKPGNILLTPYGRPMLADFNVAFDRARIGPGGARYGGTLAYMAPEYRDAVFGRPGGAADERCDIYALGVVLYELATGARPHPAAAPAAAPTVETLSPGDPTLSDPAESPAAPPALDLGGLAAVPRELAAVIRRCLETDPAARYQTAAELAAALGGAWHLLSVRKAMPGPSRVGRWAMASPAWALAAVALLPHLAGSVAQISYNAVEVKLTDAQKPAFLGVVIAYNLLAYPLCLGVAVRLIRRQVRGLKLLPGLPGADVDALRGRSLRLAGQAAALGAAGWLPGAVVFPLAIDLAAGPLRWQEYAHFAVSFALAGVIAVVFSYLGFQYVVFRAILPRVGNPDTYTPARTAAAVRSLTSAFGPLVMLACGVPLVGAVLLLTLEDGLLTLGFRLLVVMLIGLGVAGVALAERVVRRLRELAAVWLSEGGERTG